jgi:hypothetical protein
VFVAWRHGFVVRGDGCVASCGDRGTWFTVLRRLDVLCVGFGCNTVDHFVMATAALVNLDLNLDGSTATMAEAENRKPNTLTTSSFHGGINVDCGHVGYDSV